jgi:hypothetical protein
VTTLHTGSQYDYRPSDPGFTLYKINAGLQDVDLKMANIVMKDSDWKKSLEKEVMQTVHDSPGQVCRNTRDGKHSTALINIAKSTGHSFLSWSQDKSFSWHNLHTQLSFLLTNGLSREEVKESKRKTDNNTLALAAKHQQGRQAQGKKGTSCPGAASNTGWLANWVCSKCRQKNHLQKDCPNQPNSNAASLSNRRSARRLINTQPLLNNNLCMQRKRINNATE